MKIKLILFLLVICCTRVFCQASHDEYVAFAIANNQKLFDLKSQNENILIEENVIHIFVNDKGDLLDHNIPKTATDKNLFKIHLIVDKNVKDEFKLYIDSYTNNSSPNFSSQWKIINSKDVKLHTTDKSQFKEFVYSPVGPFINSFSFNINRKTYKLKSPVESTIFDFKVKIESFSRDQESERSDQQPYSYNEYRDFVMENHSSKFISYKNEKKNQIVIDGVIHIFINDKGQLIETGIPTTATEENMYKIHLIVDNRINDEFKLYTVGDYQPTLNIRNQQNQENGTDRSFSKNDNDESKFIEYIYETVGPFTKQFSFEIKEIENGTESSIISANIKIAKLYHVSISTGIFRTSLQNPINIKESLNSDGERTLVADDVNSRGMVVLNAVFYPKGRSFLFPPSGGPFSLDRFGVLAGTQLDTDQFENFLGGIQFDFARGGSVAGGIHYGRVNKIIGYKNFDFGEEVFEGDFEKDVVKDWDIGFFLGVNLDVRIFGQLFGSND